MANIVIVTQQCYLLCEAINYIAINEIDESDERKLSFFNKPTGKKGKKPTKRQLEEWRRQQFQIVIDFVPAAGVTPSSSGLSKHNSGNTATVAIKVSGRDHVLALFSHMVEQIREQIPDNKFLDDIVSKFLQEDKDT
jgi:hypothetical protein